MALLISLGCSNLEINSLGICIASGVTEQSLTPSPGIGADIGITSIPSEDLLGDAQKAADLGFKVFKFWPHISNLKIDELKEIFENPVFEVLIIMPPPNLSFEKTAELLLSQYFDIPKTVILTNWESDWVLSGGSKCFYDPLCVAPGQRVRDLADQFSANQRGINNVKNRFSDSKLKIYYAVEVNLPILAPKIKKASVTQDVIPLMNPKPDYVSYSSWETVNNFTNNRDTAEREFVSALNLIADKVGHRNVFLGEIGFSKSDIPCERKSVLKRAIEIGRQWGAQYFVYWNLHGEEFGLDQEAYEALQD